MDTFTTICLAALEVVGVCVSVHLWFRKQRMRIVPCLFWSIVLLIPLFGLLMFVFIADNPDKNPDRQDTQADRDATTIAGGGW